MKAEHMRCWKLKNHSLKIKMRFFRLFILVSPLFLLTCHIKKRVTKSNLAYLYSNESTIVHPVFKVYHSSSSESTIYVRVKSSEILYSKNNTKKVFQGKMVMQVDIYSLHDKKKISSDTVYLFDKSGPSDEKYLLGEIDIPISFGQKYMAEISFDDLYRMQFVQDIVFIDKTNEYSEENYLIKNEAGEVQFGNIFDPGSKISVKSNHPLSSKLNMLVYDPYDNLPPPPFSEQENYSPSLTGESERSISTLDKYHFEFQFEEAGVYHFPNELDGKTGLTFLVFQSYYPYIKTVASMVRPMRFITTKQEYSNLVKSENLKKDVDEFWYKIAGNSERAAEIIEQYYGRVEIANKYFTSYAQGWKTDRGLIYIIYGPPASVFKTETYENWTYSEKSNIMSVEFTFYKINNALSNNDYVLSRSSGYKSSWYRAIDSWRQGRVF